LRDYDSIMHILHAKIQETIPDAFRVDMRMVRIIDADTIAGATVEHLEQHDMIERLLNPGGSIVTYF